MSLILRSTLFLALIIVPGVQAHGRSAGADRRHRDMTVMTVAALRYAHESPTALLRFLRARHEVRAAMLGRDGATIDIRFQDGLHSMLLPARAHGVVKTRIAWGPHRVFYRHLQKSGRRALVLQPFAAQFNLGPDTGRGVIDAFQSAGFSVETVWNASVTVSVMATLSQYDAVYIDTHAGVNQYGEGVVVTGQVYDAGSDSLRTFTDDRTVFVAGVAGSPLQYYGIVSGFISKYESQFPSNALVFVNGCDMLRATLFWQALQAKGAGVMPSWDNEVLATDADTAATTFLQAMVHGATAQEATDAVIAGGLGLSTVPGETPAHFGFLGNGSVRLDGSAAPTPTPAPPPATATPPIMLTAAPTVTPSPAPSTPTATSRIAGRLALVMRLQVRPGERQIIRVVATPLTILNFVVRYPNGDRRSATVLSDSAGVATYRYKQPGNRIARFNRTARVTVSSLVAGEPVQTATRSYLLAFGRIDVAAEPRRVDRHGSLRLWIHTAGAGRMAISIAGPALGLRHAFGTVARGWHALPVSLPRTVGAMGTERVTADLVSASRTYVAHTSFTVR
ncbi:MAG: hypothetical protein NVS4B2_14130 [Chloroflexota bacterium]